MSKITEEQARWLENLLCERDALIADATKAIVALDRSGKRGTITVAIEVAEHWGYQDLPEEQTFVIPAAPEAVA